jgi:hypothetical protein
MAQDDAITGRATRRDGPIGADDPTPGRCEDIGPAMF